MAISPRDAPVESAEIELLQALLPKNVVKFIEHSLYLI
jgi:hypothetical protein